MSIKGMQSDIRFAPAADAGRYIAKQTLEFTLSLTAV